MKIKTKIDPKVVQDTLKTFHVPLQLIDWIASFKQQTSALLK